MTSIFPPLREGYEGGISTHPISQKGCCHYHSLIPSSPSSMTFYLCLVHPFGQNVYIFRQNPDLTKF